MAPRTAIIGIAVSLVTSLFGSGQPSSAGQPPSDLAQRLRLEGKPGFERSPSIDGPAAGGAEGPQAEAFPHEGGWVTNVIIVGGTAVISPVVASQLQAQTNGEVIRLAGANRYETAVWISQFLFPFGADTVYLATASNFPDALAGGPAAAFEGAPILLVSPTDLTDATRDELIRLDPDKIVLLGGTAVISNAISAQAASATGAAVIRLAGSNRYATSAAISAATFQPGVDVAYISYGGNFPDALAGGPAAGLNGGPILLVEKNSIPGVIKTELLRLLPQQIVILGGPAVVASAVEAELAAYTGGPVTRLSGDNRFSTAAAISAAYFPTGVHAVIVAIADNFPDALAAGPMGAFGGFPLLLVNRDSVPAATSQEISDLMPTPNAGHTITTIDSGSESFPNMGEYTSIGIAGDGDPTIAYSNVDANRMRVADCVVVTCATGTVLGPECCNGGGIDISLEIRSAGVPSVASTDDLTSGVPLLTRCSDSACTVATNNTVQSPLTPDVGAHTALTLGGDGNPIVVYRSAGDPAIAFCTSSNCSVYTTVVVADAGDSGYDNSIALGDDGHPVISYYNDTNGDLVFFRCNEAGLPCSGAPVIVDSAGDVGWFTSMVIGSDGYPAISYYDADNRTLKFAHCSDAGCTSATTTTIDGGFNLAGLFSTDTSITVGSDGYPIISYYELILPFLGRLKVADCEDITCTSVDITVVDSLADVGGGSSITIGTDGKPIISYYDYWNGDLKVAHLGG